jgi:hypothetical protein
MPTETTIPTMPELRPVRLQGKAYYDALKRILREIGSSLLQDAIDIKTETHTFTPHNLCYLALKYRLNVKATCEWLEESGFLLHGTYQTLRERRFKPMYVVRQVWSECYQELAS